MQVKELINREEWGAAPDRHLLQSWEWGEILRAEGREVKRLVVMDGEQIVAWAQVIYYSLPFGWRYAFCPRGPVIRYQMFVPSSSLAFGTNSAGGSTAKYQELWDVLFDYFQRQKCVFLRLEPDDFELPVTSYKLPIRRTIDINPRATLILDLEKSEEELLAGMHPKTRYNIRLAGKKGLSVKWDKNAEAFIALMNKTARQDGFRPHPAEHYWRVLTSPLTRQATVYNNQQSAIATAVPATCGDTMTYLYGASDYDHRDLMAPHLAQWEIIKLGKKLGYKRYDFFGVAPLAMNECGGYEYEETHQYAGVTRFKLGFGGQPEESAGTHDVIIDGKKYLLYQLLRKVRRIF